MRIDGTRRYGAVGPADRTSASASTTAFELDTGARAPEAQATSSALPAAGLDSLIALQFVEDRAQKRKRGFQRGRSMLDALDRIKLSLLEGTIPAAELARLLSAVSGRERDSDDPQLEGLLDEIELRARVEMAKLKTSRRTY